MQDVISLAFVAGQVIPGGTPSRSTQGRLPATRVCGPVPEHSREVPYPRLPGLSDLRALLRSLMDVMDQAAGYRDVKSLASARNGEGARQLSPTRRFSGAHIELLFVVKCPCA
jgi:hypothetical protein